MAYILSLLAKVPVCRALFFFRTRIFISSFSSRRVVSCSSCSFASVSCSCFTFELFHFRLKRNAPGKRKQKRRRIKPYNHVYIFRTLDFLLKYVRKFGMHGVHSLHDSTSSVCKHGGTSSYFSRVTRTILRHFVIFISHLSRHEYGDRCIGSP